MPVRERGSRARPGLRLGHLLLQRTQRKNDLAVDLVEDLGDSCIYGGETADDPFPAGDLADHLVASPISDGEQDEEHRQGREDDLKGPVELKSAYE